MLLYPRSTCFMPVMVLCPCALHAASINAAPARMSGMVMSAADSVFCPVGSLGCCGFKCC